MSYKGEKETQMPVNEEDTIKAARVILGKMDRNILNNGERLYTVFKVLAPEVHYERKVMRLFASNGCVAYFETLDSTEALDRFKRILCDEVGMDDHKADYYLMLLKRVYGITSVDTDIYISDISELQDIDFQKYSRWVDIINVRKKAFRHENVRDDVANMIHGYISKNVDEYCA